MPGIVYLIVFVTVAALFVFVGFRIIDMPSGSKSSAVQSPYPSMREWRNPVLLARQLRAVKDASFHKLYLLNKSEFRVFKIIEAEIASAKKGYRVFAQVSLGEVIDSKNREAFFAINSKRVDFLIVDANSLPVVAVEYQGSGHFQGTAEARDAIKDSAVQKAGIGFIEIFESDNADDIRARVRENLGWTVAPQPAPEVKAAVIATETEPQPNFGRARSLRV